LRLLISQQLKDQLIPTHKCALTIKLSSRLKRVREALRVLDQPWLTWKRKEKISNRKKNLSPTLKCFVVLERATKKNQHCQGDLHVVVQTGISDSNILINYIKMRLRFHLIIMKLNRLSLRREIEQRTNSKSSKCEMLI